MNRLVVRIAHYPERAGNTAVIEGQDCVYVPYSQDADVLYQKYTKDFSKRSDRPYRVRGKAFASLGNAVREVIKQGVLNG